MWLAYWSEEENQHKNKWIFFSVFSALGIASVIFMFFRICMLTKGVIKLGRDVHHDMVEKLIKAPINLFHETIPRGQIYNRLSKDLDQMNFSMWALGDLLISLFSVIGAFVLCGYYDPFSLLYMPIVFIAGYFVTRFYLRGSRPLTRISSISRSNRLQYSAGCSILQAGKMYCIFPGESLVTVRSQVTSRPLKPLGRSLETIDRSKKPRNR